jgi:hypothetical protein
MATIQIGQLPAFVVGLPTNIPADVENDTQTAAHGTININIAPTQGFRGFLTIEPVEVPDVGLPTPTNGALTATAGGTLAATNYFVRTTYVNENGGESPLSVETSLAVSADDVLNVASPAAAGGSTNSQGTDTGAIYWRVYVSNTAGGGSGAETLQATLPTGTAYVEPVTGLVVGAPLPNQLAGLVNGPCTVTVTQGAGTIAVTTTQ